MARSQSPNGNQDIVALGEVDGLDYIGHPGAASNETGAFINHAVPNRAGIVIARISGLE